MKDTLSNAVAIILVIAGALNTYLQSLNGGEINWLQLILVIGGAVIAYLTGKTQDLSGKS